VLSSEIEAFPNGLLESMASGCAPVGSRVGGVPEMLGEDGMMFPVGDDAALAALLERLRDDVKLRKSLGASAVRRASERFSLERNLQRTAEVYTETLAEKGIRV
jgi:glycosyltransferase involved in cell wall biosynthesis